MIDVYRNGAPLSLVESRHARHATGGVTHQNRDPDVDWFQGARAPDEEADAQGNQNLRDDRDVEWALGISRSLKSAGVSQSRGDQQAGHAEDPEQLDPDLHYGRLVHSENGQQSAGEAEKEDADESGSANPVTSGYVH